MAQTVIVLHENTIFDGADLHGSPVVLAVRGQNVTVRNCVIESRHGTAPVTFIHVRSPLS